MRFMLYEFLKNNYKEAEPIFFSDIVIKGITKSAVNQQLKKLCDEGKLQKYENGICLCNKLQTVYAILLSYEPGYTFQIDSLQI